MQRINKWLVTFTCVYGLAACSSTEIKEVWQDESFSKEALKKVLVVGMTGNISSRRVYENEFSRRLQSDGVEALSSYQVLGSSMPDKQKIMAYVNGHDINYVLVTYQDVAPPASDSAKAADGKSHSAAQVFAYNNVYGVDGSPNYAHLGNYWGDDALGTLQTPEYFDKSASTILVTAIYDAKTQELRWSGRSATVDTKSISQAASEVAAEIVDHIRSKPALKKP